MKKIAILLVLCALCCSSALAQDTMNWGQCMSLPSKSEQQSYRTNDIAPYIVCWPQFEGADKFMEYAVDFRAEHLPRGTYLAVANWCMGSYELERKYTSVNGDYGWGVGGYCGFQVWEDGTLAAILTLWDLFCTDKNGRTTVIRANQVYPENERGAERCVDSAEGSFLHCLIPFDWKEDHSYRALLQIANKYNGEGANLIFYVCDLETGVWTLLMEFELGYDEAYMTDFASFLENYVSQYAGELRSMVLSNYRAHPYGGGEWITARSAYFVQNYVHAGSFNYGADGSRFWAVTTGIPGRCVNPEGGWYKVSGGEKGQPY